MSEDNEQLIATPGTFGDNGNFLLERELGRGGMGGVYMGRDKMLDRPVAVKVMLKEYGSDEEFVGKFKKEAQAAARLIHPNIAQIYSYGISDGMPYIAMELVAGGSLQQLMNNAPDGKTDIPRVLKIGEQVAQALRCAADQGLVHGDIKPDNILLDANGNAKIVDFGLAGMQKDTSEIWGTPYYIAPEKLKKETVDYRADMYNLGGTLYHALTGVAPFEGTDATAVVRKRFEGKPALPSSIRPEITPAVDELIMKMLELEKKDRYPTLEALLEAFKTVMATGLTAGPSTSKTSVPATGTHKPGTRRMTTMHARRKTSMKLGTGKISTGKVNLDGTGQINPEDLENISGMTGKMNLENIADEEEEGNIGKKVILSVVGGITAIALLAGGIAWYVVADKKSRAAAKQTMIVNKIAEAREVIETNRRAAEKFGVNVEDFATKAIEECEKATKKMAEFVPEFADRLKPEPSQELIAAIALTNAPVAVAEGTNGVSAVSNAAPAVAVAPAASQPTAGGFQIKPFRPPTEDEADPASPEHEEYEKLKKAHMEEQMKLFKQAIENPEKAKEEEKAAKKKAIEEATDDDLGTSDDPVKKLEIAIQKCERKYKREVALVGEEAVQDINDLWNRAYSCQASAIKIGIEVKKSIDEARKAEGITGETEEAMNQLAALGGTVKDVLEGAKGSKEIENLQKGLGYIKSKATKSLKQTTDNLYRRRAETDREKKKLEYQLEKLKEEIKNAEARKKLVAEEQETAKTKFDSLQQNKNFELLEWDAAIKEIEFMKSNFKTPEGGLAADDQLKKVKVMKLVQEILVQNMENYQFKKSKLGVMKATAVGANMKEIALSKPDGKDTKKVQKFKINWVKFYKEYHANFNELLIRFIENGRANSQLTVDGKKTKLTLQQWGDAMCGAALTLRIICSDDAAAATRGEAIAKEVEKKFPNYVKTLRMMFPDLTFEDAPEE